MGKENRTPPQRQPPVTINFANMDISQIRADELFKLTDRKMTLFILVNFTLSLLQKHVFEILIFFVVSENNVCVDETCEEVEIQL